MIIKFYPNTTVNILATQTTVICLIIPFQALFEIITSEASYYRSLNVLIEVFYKAPWMQPGIQGSLISSTDKHHLFSNVLAIHMTSGK